VTNNSTKSRRGYLKKFLGLGLDVKAEEIFSSSFAAAAYLEQNPLPENKKVYIIGQEGIGQELELLNIPHFGGPEDSDKTIKLGPGVKVEHDRDVGAGKFLSVCLSLIFGRLFLYVVHVCADVDWSITKHRPCCAIHPILYLHTTQASY
tara:strand:- start:402 stop:848 length:447 start_codon:yes stop_codon:yes gene_type:complete